MDEELLHEVGKRFSRVITVENGVIKGGLAVLFWNLWLITDMLLR